MIVPVSAADVDKGVREGWLVPEEDGWHRFVYDFERDELTGRWRRVPARSMKRVRVLATAKTSAASGEC